MHHLCESYEKPQEIKTDEMKRVTLTVDPDEYAAIDKMAGRISVHPGLFGGPCVSFWSVIRAKLNLKFHLIGRRVDVS